MGLRGQVGSIAMEDLAWPFTRWRQCMSPALGMTHGPCSGIAMAEVAGLFAAVRAEVLAALPPGLSPLETTTAYPCPSSPLAGLGRGVVWMMDPGSDPPPRAPSRSRGHGPGKAEPASRGTKRPQAPRPNRWMLLVPIPSRMQV